MVPPPLQRVDGSTRPGWMIAALQEPCALLQGAEETGGRERPNPREHARRQWRQHTLGHRSICRDACWMTSLGDLGMSLRATSKDNNRAAKSAVTEEKQKDPSEAGRSRTGLQPSERFSVCFATASEQHRRL